jgi:hypothetical protein
VALLRYQGDDSRSASLIPFIVRLVRRALALSVAVPISLLRDDRTPIASLKFIDSPRERDGLGGCRLGHTQTAAGSAAYVEDPIAERHYTIQVGLDDAHHQDSAVLDIGCGPRKTLE